MCRLYGFRATEATKVECTLVHAQNALLAQSRGDLAGLTHTHGWGIATYEGETPHVERQAWAAYHGEHFQRAAARAYATTVIAHIRRATVGGPRLENTHPFNDGRWTFAHNGTVPHFDRVRERLLAVTSPRHRAAIQGETDSEHIFRYAMTLIDAQRTGSAADVVRRVVQDVERWTREIDANARIGLNVMLSDGEQLAGARLGRTLVYVVRNGIYDCEICGFPHIRHDPHRDYRAIEVASEPLTHETWQEVPERSVWEARIEQSELVIAPL